ncbi:transcriptional regulator [Streptomyces sp. A244]|uniref:ROK family transcriptional regulator n=1 Tax=Streptomyces sp. A244 TaxID=2137016 RepID=UPI000D19D5C4|nr:ROK family transcriptional regulator [Streptomyces sp. A244]PTH89215.1 transcriptional regulator [Streptomyces sp. A244]
MRGARGSGPTGPVGPGGPGGGVNLLALRSHNAALVLDLLRAAGDEGISRLELAERTGLTPQAVSKITARLREDGLAAEAGHRASTGGKPRTVLRLVPEAGHAVGVHLDRDEVRAVLVDLRGTVVGERRAALDLGAGAEAVLGAVRETVAGLPTAGTGGEGNASRLGPARPDPTLLGVGVALPGPLDHARGVLHRVTGFPEWDGFPLREALAERLGVPVVVDKDTNAAALGLAAGGQGGSFAYLHLGTGLGAGLVIGGSVHRGARTGAGEFGHQVIQLDGPPCTCGNRGCVEALCLGAVERGDLREAARVLGAGAANLVGLLDIDVVLLGGRTVAAAPETFTDGVGAVLKAWARRTGQDAVPVRVAADGGGAVAAGAAELVLGPVFGRGGG